MQVSNRNCGVITWSGARNFKGIKVSLRDHQFLSTSSPVTLTPKMVISWFRYWSSIRMLLFRNKYFKRFSLEAWVCCPPEHFYLDPLFLTNDKIFETCKFKLSKKYEPMLSLITNSSNPLPHPMLSTLVIWKLFHRAFKKWRQYSVGKVQRNSDVTASSYFLLRSTIRLQSFFTTSSCTSLRKFPLNVTESIIFTSWYSKQRWFVFKGPLDTETDERQPAAKKSWPCLLFFS